MLQEFINCVSKELKLIRIENGDKIEDLSKKNGVAPSTISRYELGREGMNLEKIEQIISPYGIDLSIFFERVIAKTQDKKEE